MREGDYVRFQYRSNEVYSMIILDFLEGFDRNGDLGLISISDSFLINENNRLEDNSRDLNV